MAEIGNTIQDLDDIFNGERDEGAGEQGGEEGHPSVSDILAKGFPSEWIILIGICSIFAIFTMVHFVKAIFVHKKYSTKHTMQFLSTMGILFVYPLYSIMYISGMVVPRANSKCTFIAESYESLSLLFFLKLILTYMGGKRNAVKSLKGTKVHLNSPPFCCIPLPPVKFSGRFLFVNELFVVQLIVIELVMGYIDVLMTMDQSKSYPAALVEETYSHIFHGISLVSLCFAVYGLSSIYHSAEKQLLQFNIFKKFVCYKIIVTLAKIQDITFSILSQNEVFGDMSKGAFSTHLRVHIWSSALTIAECTAIFQVALKAFPISDYPTYLGDGTRPPPSKLIKRVASEKRELKINFDIENLVPPDKVQLLQSEHLETKNVLLLTDCILSTISSSKFPEDMKCTKKSLGKFLDIRKYLSIVGDMDYVVVAAGINDILKHHISPQFLMKFTLDFYEECARECPRTKFVFSSLLPTAVSWANDAAEEYNGYVFELSLRYPNLLFFDNYQLSSRDILLEDGLQVSNRAVSFIARALFTALRNLSRCYNDPQNPWPLRPEYVERAVAFKSSSFVN